MEICLGYIPLPTNPLLGDPDLAFTQLENQPRRNKGCMLSAVPTAGLIIEGPPKAATTNRGSSVRPSGATWKLTCMHAGEPYRFASAGSRRKEATVFRRMLPRAMHVQQAYRSVALLVFVSEDCMHATQICYPDPAYQRFLTRDEAACWFLRQRVWPVD